MKRFKDCYLVRWKSQGMLFWRWNFCFDDEVIIEEACDERMVLYRRNGSVVDVPYASTCFMFSKKREELRLEE